MMTDYFTSVLAFVENYKQTIRFAIHFTNKQKFQGNVSLSLKFQDFGG